MKKVVIPGEVVSTERKRMGSNVFIQNGKICSEVLGITTDEGDMASVVALKGVYLPKENDVVVGIVSSEKFAGYNVNINCFYESFISRKELVKITGLTEYSIKHGVETLKKEKAIKRIGPDKGGHWEVKK